MTPSWEAQSPEEANEAVAQEELDDCWSHGNGIMFSGAEEQAVFLETIARISARNWELSGRGADGFRHISRNRIRLNFHLAHYLFLVVMGRACCWGEAQSGATFGFGSGGWEGQVAVVIWHITYLHAVGRTCRKARCLQSPVLAITALRVILCD